MKGITIFLVVLGHCIQYGNGKDFDFFSDTAFKIIYSFHMPLFALVSGYLFFWSVSSRHPGEVILRQVNNLILPVFSWTLLMNIIDTLAHIYGGGFQGINITLWNISRGLISGFWFLRAMFIASMIVLFVREKLSDSLKYYALILIFLLFVPGSGDVFMYPYFVAGYICHREGFAEKFCCSKFMCLVLILAWCILLMFYDNSSYIYTTGTSIIDYKHGCFKAGHTMTDIFRWLIGFVGCGAVLILLRLIHPVKFIAAIGTRSLGIYIMSGYFMRFLPEMVGYAANFAEAVVITALCYAISEAISRVKVLNRILFGGR